MTMLLEKTIKKIVYIQEFDKYDNHGKLLCRNISCNKYPQPPYKKYCSRKCNKEFRHWYYHNFFWERIRYLTYSNVITIHVRFAKESLLIFIEGNLPGLKI